MANTFKNSVAQNIGTTLTTVYTAPASSTAIVIGFSISNKIGTQITVNANIYDASGSIATALISPNTPIDVGGALIVAGGDQKIVLEENDYIEVASSDASSVDVVISVLEIT